MDAELKKIAKAAGLVVVWSEERYGHRDEPMVRKGWRIVRTDVDSSGIFGDWWNPKTNDGDALRLASVLHMQINNHPDCVEARCWDDRGKETCIAESTGHTNRERFAATRSVILRAAKAMVAGRDEPEECCGQEVASGTCCAGCPKAKPTDWLIPRLPSLKAKS